MTNNSPHSLSASCSIGIVYTSQQLPHLCISITNGSTQTCYSLNPFIQQVVPLSTQVNFHYNVALSQSSSQFIQPVHEEDTSTFSSNSGTNDLKSVYAVFVSVLVL